MNRLLLIGCGGHAKSIIELVADLKEWQILGLIGQPDEIGKKVLGYECIATDNDIKDLYKSCSNIFIGLGQLKSPKKRKFLAELIESYSFSSPAIISKKSIVSKYSTIGNGTSIGHGAIVNANAEISSYCIINSMALIEHDVKISKFCHVSTGALINGGVEIGEGSFVGSGAIIREGIKIPPYSIISAGEKIMGWPSKTNKE